MKSNSMNKLRGVFKTLKNVYDGAIFFKKLVKTVRYFCKTFHHRYLAGS